MKGMRRVVIGTAFATILFVWAAAAESAEIRFRSQANCRNCVVRLGDVADIITVDKREREALRALELGPVGPSRQTLRARDVQDRLADQGVKLVHHEFSGAATIFLEANAGARDAGDQRPLSKSALNLARTTVADRIAAHLKETVDPDEDWTIEVDLTAEQARILSADHRRATVTGGRAPWTGAQKFTVTVPDGSGSRSFAVEADVERAPRVVVTVNPIARGERIRAADVELQRVTAGSAQRFALESLDEVVGKEAARNIAAGQALDNHYVRAPLLVQRGDVVDLFARAGGVQITTKARAREPGSHGDLINVELLSDRRPLLARVCGIQEVEILAAGPSVSE